MIKKLIYLATKIAWLFLMVMIASRFMIDALAGGNYVIFGIITAINLILWGFVVFLDLKLNRDVNSLKKRMKYLKEENKFYKSWGA